MRESLAEKTISDGSKVSVERIHTETYKGLMLVIVNKSLILHSKYLPDVFERRATTAGKIFKEISQTDTFESVCNMLE